MVNGAFSREISGVPPAKPGCCRRGQRPKKDKIFVSFFHLLYKAGKVETQWPLSWFLPKVPETKTTYLRIPPPRNMWTPSTICHFMPGINQPWLILDYQTCNLRQLESGKKGLYGKPGRNPMCRTISNFSSNFSAGELEGKKGEVNLNKVLVKSGYKSSCRDNKYTNCIFCKETT